MPTLNWLVLLNSNTNKNAKAPFKNTHFLVKPQNLRFARQLYQFVFEFITFAFWKKTLQQIQKRQLHLEYLGNSRNNRQIATQSWYAPPRGYDMRFNQMIAVLQPEDLWSIRTECATNRCMDPTFSQAGAFQYSELHIFWNVITSYWLLGSQKIWNPDTNVSRPNIRKCRR